MTDTVIGFTTADGVLMATDMSAVRSILKFKDNQEKLINIDSDKIMGMSGVAADVENFSEYIARNIDFYKHRTGTRQTTHAVANFTRNALATALRRAPYQVNCLIAGVDPTETVAEDEKKGEISTQPTLYFIDYLGASQKVEKGVHGYAAYFCFATLDRYWRPNLTLDEAKEVMRNAFLHFKTFLIALPKFQVNTSLLPNFRC
eukprot:GABV01002288.1.p1 GENE.GABV01002288.1~~GABV01002288.1.p1  ORF type:complete len:203 (+),score=64.64 GABV01002288.1:105-713(+)